MMYGMSPLRRTLYFVLPLLAALLFTAIVAVDAARTPDWEVLQAVEAVVPEGHHWMLFDFGNVDSARESAGAVVTVQLERESVRSELTESGGELLIDLGEEAVVSGVEIAWPDGKVQSYDSVPTNARFQVRYPNNATNSLGQWLQMRGPVYRLGAWSLLGLLAVLLAVRIFFWAENRVSYH